MKNINEVIDKDNKLDLVHSFQDACSDKEFYNYLKTLPISEDILMKYTSSLQDAFKESKNCHYCRGLNHCKNRVVGYCYTPEKNNNTIIFSYVACKHEQKRLKDDAYKDNLELFDMPEEIANANLQEVYTDDKARIPIIHYFKEFMEKYQKGEKPKGLYLTGSFGSGKTYLISATFNELAKEGI